MKWYTDGRNIALVFFALAMGLLTWMLIRIINGVPAP